MRTLEDWRLFRELEGLLLKLAKKQLSSVNYNRCCKLYREFLSLPVSAQKYTLHGDLKGDNILISNSELFFIDFDNACRGEKVFDLFRLTQGYGFSVLPQAISILDLESDSKLMKKIHFHLMFECIKNFNPKNKTELTQKHQKMLEELSHQSLIHLFNNELQHFGNFKRIFIEDSRRE